MPEGKLLVLDGLSFSVRNGGFCSIIGPSGCGKTTLLRIIAGLESLDGGTLEVKPSARRPGGTALVYQQNDLFPWLSVEDNIALSLKHKGLSQAEIKSRVHIGLERMGLEAFSSFYPTRLSGGMQKRVSLARALAQESELILLDEPFAFLDSQTRMLMQELVATLYAERDGTLLLVTHDIAEAVLLSETIVVLSARPARVKSVISVHFPYPRRAQELRTSAQAAEIFTKIDALLREEARVPAV